MVNLRNIFFWFILVLIVGFLYHITSNFIIAEAIGEEITVSEEETTPSEDEEPDCEWNYNHNTNCGFYSCFSMGNIEWWNIMKI